MLKKGDVLENRYKVLSFLGEGGMSRVYLVKDLRLDNRWVLKEFSFRNGNIDERERLEKSFIAEAKFCARLSHVGIPRVVDYFTHNTRHYLVEEYIEGESLLDKIENKKLSFAEIIPIAMKLCDVLEYIHSQGIVYRDLKPDNVIIMHDNNVKLIDFGIARVFKRGKEKDTIVMGTPGFAAPEQYGTAQTDLRADIYSLGALLHMMITRRDPREKPFAFEPPSTLGVKIAPYLENIIMKALSIKARDRYPSAAAMKAAILAARSEMTGSNRQIAASIPKLEKKKKVKRIISRKKTLPQVKIQPRKPPADPYRKFVYLIYAVVFFMLLALLIEMKFKIWVLIPYFIGAWVIVGLVLFMAWGGKKHTINLQKAKHQLPSENGTPPVPVKKPVENTPPSPPKRKSAGVGNVGLRSDDDQWWRL